jgi:phage shock protein PspC (stress-responsive transcriptional regulator)
MKKTLNINLGGMAFIIDENAFEVLFNYLEALKRKFKNETERDEILHDIEARMAELLTAKLAGRKEVLSLTEIQAVVDALGKPEDIAGEDAEATATEPTNGAAQQTTTTNTQQPYIGPVKKRLYRDADDAKVGGVIAGLCHYFGIEDPVWMRIAALVLIPVTSGAIILLYFLLLIVLPKALTAAEKLQMKGEPVNINTIEKEVKDAATRTGESVNKLVGDDGFFGKLWSFIVVVTLGFAKFISGVVIFFALCALAVLLLSMFGITIAGKELLEHAPNLLVDNPSVITIFKIGAGLFFATPLIAIIYAAIRALVGKNKGRAPWLKWVLLLGWWIGVFMIGYSVWECGMAFRSTGTIHQNIAIAQPANSNLTVILTDSTGNMLPDKEDEDDEENFHISLNGVFVNGQDISEVSHIIIGEPSLQLMPSVNDSFYIETVLNSQGRTRSDAIKNISYAVYGFTQTDSLIKLPGYVLLDKNGKYRHQNVKVRIHIPEGKKINFGRNIDRWVAVVKGDNSYDDTYFANTTWTVENGKVKCERGENHFNADKDKEEDKDSAKDEDKSDKEDNADKDY